MNLISPQVFTTLRMPMLSGRIFDDSEMTLATHLAVVNQAMVQRYFDGQNPIGRHVRSTALKIDQPGFVSSKDPDGWLEITGVVADARNAT